MLKLQVSTSPAWIDGINADFGAFLQDHAACERKASATALSLVCHYPDQEELVREMIHLAQEELEHFRQVVVLLTERGLTLAPDEKDAYVVGLLKHVRHGRDHYFLDRLLVGGIIEARGCERFGMLAEGIDDPTLQTFYQELTRAEARHHGLFVRLARKYFSDEVVRPRLEALLVEEATLVEALPFRAALH